MHIQLITIAGSSNVGLYAFANDHICFVGNDASDEDIVTIKESLQVPVIRANICGTPLAGIFIAGNNDVIFVPDIIFDKEFEELKKSFDRVVKLRTDNTALGNNLLVTEKGCIVSPDMEQSVIKQLEEELGFSVKVMTIAHLPTVGSLVISNAKGGVVTHDASDDAVEQISEILGVPMTIGTVNFGSGFLSSGVISNSNGVLVGKSSTGVEVNNIDEALGFLNS